ncbi:hypothetical protein D4Z93_04585 [Clostridium fermenticellae]|uniref:Uncharacterized protein n=1 Tax=Clostridium fermenticellae TaxID=2068654 RepID=A0A386H298_9CLOT|nr:hypothetical protein [Clostridium fermenticellae]AYD39831.1 hypothetical protein D4Z93_04585 [Clostridium fermenticellae]
MSKTYIEAIQEKLNNAKCIKIKNRKITKNDILNLDNNEIICIQHPRNFDILVRREYRIINIINNLVLRFSDKNEYIVKDTRKKYKIVMTAEDCADYINKLLNYNGIN